MPPFALCEKSVKNDVSPVSTLELEVLPKTVLAFKPPEVIMPCSKSARFFLRLLRRIIQPPPNKASTPPAPPSKVGSKLSIILATKLGCSIDSGAGIALRIGFFTSTFAGSGAAGSVGAATTSTGFSANGSTGVTSAGFCSATDLASAACFCISDIALFLSASNFCISATCFSSAAALSCASLMLFSRAVTSSCNAAIFSFDALASAESILASPADNLTTSLGPALAGIDLSSVAVLILPLEDCVFASASVPGAESATNPASLLR